MRAFLTIFFLLNSLQVFGIENKVICGVYEPAYNQTTILFDKENRALNSINEEIKNAQAQGYMQASAPAIVSSRGSGDVICVTVTKL